MKELTKVIIESVRQRAKIIPTHVHGLEVKTQKGKWFDYKDDVQVPTEDHEITHVGPFETQHAEYGRLMGVYNGKGTEPHKALYKHEGYRHNVTPDVTYHEVIHDGNELKHVRSPLKRPTKYKRVPQK